MIRRLTSWSKDVILRRMKGLEADPLIKKTKAQSAENITVKLVKFQGSFCYLVSRASYTFESFYMSRPDVFRPRLGCDNNQTKYT
ncbi:hypothetical protein L1987_60054 [Smallanthus sonchifolius]|uniref:Uncharacterized protein n=1 Tax=Smallanthus sonchifolius TaxID=185202 RepID=A0ACB9D6Z6_9ASTR|nr:hypothetical protein L1987_60054 [Smallanthus sonchifolius]